MKTKIDHS